VVVAHHARDLPATFLLLPDVHELERATVVLAVFLVAEAVCADLDGTVAFDRIDLERAGDEIAARRLARCPPRRRALALE